jgi:hypothetical protein
MSKQTNKKDKTNLTEIARNTGLIIMTMAATAGLVEMPEQHEKRAILTTQPVYAFGGPQSNEDSNPLRREREEAGPHYISYGIAQRTPGRTGRF